ncbi:hypothetical protein BN1723_017713, partial [Verticillium longisporum]
MHKHGTECTVSVLRSCRSPSWYQRQAPSYSYINSDTSEEATHCIVPRRHISAAMADQQLANKAAAPAQPINLLLDIVNGRHKLSRAIPIALLIFDALLCILIILKVPYTEIDWVAYMEQIGQIVAGERDYSKIKGGTGPLVYPAAHVYAYTGLYYLTDEGTDVLFAQFLFAILYLATLAVVMACYWQAKVPPYMFPILVLSKRLHSIFVLRCFNDGVAVLFFWLAIFSMQRRNWAAGALLYSWGVGIK